MAGEAREVDRLARDEAAVAGRGQELAPVDDAPAAAAP
jgi:hypothetical protein